MTVGKGLRVFFVKGIHFNFGGDDMPRMPAHLKNEWAFFLDERGRKKYNELCRNCERVCKQSFRSIIVKCPKYISKRRMERYEKSNEQGSQ